MKSTLLKGLAMGALGLALLGCSQSPMDALKSDTVNTTYDVQYWQNTSKTDPNLFSQAVQYCQQNPGKPNCAAVSSVSVPVVQIGTPPAKKS